MSLRGQKVARAILAVSCTLLVASAASADERARRQTGASWEAEVEPSEVDPMTLDQDLDVGAVRQGEDLVCPTVDGAAGSPASEARRGAIAVQSTTGVACVAPFDAGLDARIRVLDRSSPARLLPRVSVAVRATWQGGRQVSSETPPTRAGLTRGVEWLILATWEGP